MVVSRYLSTFADRNTGCGTVGSVLGSGPRGRVFESRHPDEQITSKSNMDRHSPTIADIIRNAPKGMRLWSPAYGPVTFDRINKEGCIVVKDDVGCVHSLLPDGTVNKYGECMLFPAVDCSDWADYRKVLFRDGVFITDVQTGETVLCHDVRNGVYKAPNVNPAVEGIDVDYYRFATVEEIERWYAELHRYGFSYTTKDGFKGCRSEVPVFKVQPSVIGEYRNVEISMLTAEQCNAVCAMVRSWGGEDRSI